MKTEAIQRTFNEFKTIMSIIESSMYNYIGLGYLLENPAIINQEALEDMIRVNEIDYFSIPTHQALGLNLLTKKDRSIRATEFKSAAKRALIADTAEIVVDSIYKMHAIYKNGDDPYFGNQAFSVKFDYLYTGKHSPAQHLKKDEREFIQFCLEPLRNFIRHNNAIIIPTKKIEFNRRIFEIDLNINLVNKIELTFLQCYNIFKISRHIGFVFQQKMLKEIK